MSHSRPLYLNEKHDDRPSCTHLFPVKRYENRNSTANSNNTSTPDADMTEVARQFYENRKFTVKSLNTGFNKSKVAISDKNSESFSFV